MPTSPPETRAGRRVFISYRSDSPEAALAREIFRHLESTGHRPFMAGENLRVGDNWGARIDEELESCDCFLVLLSREATNSEMILGEVRKARRLRDERGGARPRIVPIRVDLPLESPLPYELSSYLSPLQQREWRSAADTQLLLAEILALLGSAILPSSPPSPAAELELPEGQVDLASPFYVERPPIETDCYQMIAKPDALIRIKAPRQMGKTSLMARVLHHAATLGHRTVSLSFQLADGEVFGQLDALLRWFCSSVTYSLDFPDRLDEHWRLTGSKMRATAYFERYLLRQIESPLTLALDEVDLVFQHPEVAADFFGLLRSWHEKGKSTALWAKLRLIITHSTEVYIPLRINQSPFNVGLPVELPEFTPEQVGDLARRHGLAWDAVAVERLMDTVGGHPFLVRIALYYIARREITLDALLATAPSETGLYGDHLGRQLWNLKNNSELAEAFRQVVVSPDPIRLDSEKAFKLDSMGLVHLQADRVRPRCKLYRTYFLDRLRDLV